MEKKKDSFLQRTASQKVKLWSLSDWWSNTFNSLLSSYFLGCNIDKFYFTRSICSSYRRIKSWGLVLNFLFWEDPSVTWTWHSNQFYLVVGRMSAHASGSNILCWKPVLPPERTIKLSSHWLDSLRHWLHFSVIFWDFPERKNLVSYFYILILNVSVLFLFWTQRLIFLP